MHLARPTRALALTRHVKAKGIRVEYFMLKLLYFNREVLEGWINQAKNKVLRKYTDGDGGLRNAGGNPGAGKQYQRLRREGALIRYRE